MNLDDRLKEVFFDVFGLEASSVTEETSPETVEAWDSVGHLNLILALEGAFPVQFEASEIPDLASFGAIRRRLESIELALG